MTVKKRHQGRIPITEKMTNDLRAVKDKTGWSFIALFKYAKEHKLFKETKTLNAASAGSCLNGHSKTLYLSDYRCVISAYDHIPERQYGHGRELTFRKKRVLVPDGFPKRLQAALQNTQMSVDKLLRYSGAPKGFTRGIVDRVARGDTNTIQDEHYQHLLKIIHTLEVIDQD